MTDYEQVLKNLEQATELLEWAREILDGDVCAEEWFVEHDKFRTYQRAEKAGVLRRRSDL